MADVDEDEVREATTSEISHMAVGIAFGLVFGVFVTFLFSGADVVQGLTIKNPDPIVLFNDTSAYNQSIGFYSPQAGKGIVCDTSRKDEIQISRSAYKYVDSTECRVVEEDLTEFWDDSAVENFNVYERGQELLQNRSNQ